MARSLAYLEAYYQQTKPLVVRYLAGIADHIHLRARGQAGRANSPRKISEVDKAALSGLTAEACQKLSDAELVRLHALSHTMAGKETA